MNNPDKDIRYMATNDLMTELKKEFFSPDEALERKIVQQMLRLLEDKNGEVQNLVVKCLAPLTSRLREQQQEEVLEGLMRALTSGKDEVREVSSIGAPSTMRERACRAAGAHARMAFQGRAHWLEQASRRWCRSCRPRRPPRAAPSAACCRAC